MTGKMMRAAFRGAVLLASVSSATSAWAQVVGLGTPRATIDENGVDLATGQYLQSPVSISIGGDSGLSWSPGRGDITRTGMGIYYNNQTGKNEVSIGIAGEITVFLIYGSTYTPKERNGATLTYSSSTYEYTFTNRDGDVVIFKSNGNTAVPGGQVDYAAMSMKPAGGAKLTFNYSSTSWTSYGNNPPSSIRTYTWNRLASITNDAGYGMYISYQSDTAGNSNTSYPSSSYFQAKKIELSRTSGCTASASQNCDLPTAWPRIDITYSSSGFTYTDAAGATTTITQPASVWTAIRYPGSASDDVTIGYANNKVSSVAKAGVITNYGFSDSGDTRTVTVTRGSLPSRVRTFRISTLQLLTDQWKTDPSGPTYTRTYTYDQASALLTRITEPEGNYTQFGYDGRGNVTETRRVSKTPGTPPDLVTSATFDQGCANALICNKPITTTDTRGKVTNYGYDGTHGGVTSVVGPAPDSAQPTIRPETRYGYTQLGATGAASSTGAWKLTSVSACATTTSCVGNADEQKTVIAYGYGLDPVSITAGSGDGAVSATSTRTYDRVGNVIAIDGPLAGSSDTVRTRYDLLRRPVGTVSPDPDGSGPRLSRATRTTYNADGTIQSVEQGTDSTPDAAAFGGFVSIQTLTSSYDGYHRKVKDVLTAGGTTYAVVQQSYDGLGRVDCTVTRMDPGQWNGQTNACLPQTNGPNGPDRVVRALYDAGGRQNATTSAYGTAEASTESLSYTVNGQVATVSDANGNVTALAYDGFDRPWRTCFQTASSAACAGSPSDYMQTNYSQNGDTSGVRLRDGRGVTFTYDGLGRQATTAFANPVDLTDSNINFSYDLLGRLTLSQDGNGHKAAYSYDALGRKLTETGAWGTLSSQYDVAGRRTRLTWGDGFYVSYGYDPTGATTAITENSGLTLVSYEYDDLGRRTRRSLGNGTSTSYGYDALSRLNALNLNNGGQANAVTLSYNPSGQIASRTGSNDAYAFANLQNVDRPYAVNGLNQYTSSGGVTPTYDARGNLTSAGGSSYGYNSKNQLSGIPNSYLYYDPVGRLDQVTPSNLTWEWDGSSLVTERSGGGIARRYVHGAGVDEPVVWYEGSGTGNRRWLDADERGSIVRVTNDAGTALAVNTYDEFGIPGAGNIGRFQYTGQMWMPELGFYYYKARMYSPTLGRFLQTDPIGYDAGINWYNYVDGDPVNLTDPTGLDPAPELSCSAGEVWDSGLRKCVPAPDIVVNGIRPNASNGNVQYGATPTMTAVPGYAKGGASKAEPLVCRGRALVYAGNPRHVGRTGGMLRPIRPGAAAIIPRQWTGSKTAGPVLRGGGASVTGRTGGGQQFRGLDDTAGNLDLGPDPQAVLIERANGSLYVELVTGKHEGQTSVTVIIPPDSGLNCPQGTTPVRK